MVILTPLVCMMAWIVVALKHADDREGNAEVGHVIPTNLWWLLS